MREKRAKRDKTRKIDGNLIRKKEDEQEQMRQRKRMRQRNRKRMKQRKIMRQKYARKELQYRMRKDKREQMRLREDDKEQMRMREDDHHRMRKICLTSKTRLKVDIRVLFCFVQNRELHFGWDVKTTL